MLRHLLGQDDQRNAYRLYLSQPLPDGLLPIGPRTSTRVIRLPRLWTQVGLSTEMLVSPPDVLFVPSHVLPLVTPVALGGGRVRRRPSLLSARARASWSGSTSSGRFGATCASPRGC